MKTKIGLPFGLALVMFIGVFTTMLALGALNPQPTEAADDFSVSLSNTITGHSSDWSFSVTAENGFSAGVVDAVVAANSREASQIEITFPSNFLDGNGGAAIVPGNWELGGTTVDTAPTIPTNNVLLITAPDGMTPVSAGGELSVKYTAPSKGLNEETGNFFKNAAGTDIEIMVTLRVDTDEDTDFEETSTLDSEAFSIDTTRVGQLEVTPAPPIPERQPNTRSSSIRV